MIIDVYKRQSDDWKDVGNLHHAQLVVEELCIFHRVLDIFGSSLTVTRILFKDLVG